MGRAVYIDKESGAEVTIASSSGEVLRYLATPGATISKQPHKDAFIMFPNSKKIIVVMKGIFNMLLSEKKIKLSTEIYHLSDD